MTRTVTKVATVDLADLETCGALWYGKHAEVALVEEATESYSQVELFYKSLRTSSSFLDLHSLQDNLNGSGGRAEPACESCVSI